MTVSFFSNFLNEHQIPFCTQMANIEGVDFKFIATEPISQERLLMGFQDESHTYPFTINSWEDDVQMREAERLGCESDVVILGSAPMRFIEQRLRENKLTFRYNERFFKRGRWRILDPRVARAHYLNDFRWRKKNYYMLCASAYTAPDCRFIHSYKNKTLRWGYFPEVKEYDIDDLMRKKPTKKMAILWVGRQIDWKRPCHAIHMAAALKSQGYDFELTMIGEGPMRSKMEKLVAQTDLWDCVKFENFMPQSKVREYMERSNIFIFTSNRQEGWGAVLNEAMNSGCAIVANDEIGSVPFLIEDGKNGFFYHKTPKALTTKVGLLIADSKLTSSLGRKAYITMHDKWSASIGAQRLTHLINALLNNNQMDIWNDGPISKC